MIGFKRWLYSLVLALGVCSSTLGCQVLFGDFNVGDQGRAGDSGVAGSSASGGGSNANGGAAGAPPMMGPLVVVPSSGLYTSDLGATARFYVSLAHKPTAPITVPITSNNTAEGTVSTSSLIFTPDDWNAPQVVTVTGVHDMAMGNQDYTVEVGPVVSEQKDFNGANAVVSITNIDNDSPGIFVTPTTGLVTTESRGQAFFTVVLNSEPKGGDVTITLTSSDETLGTVSPSSLTFTANNWSAIQKVTLTGVDNKVADGDHPYQITVDPRGSTDPSYKNLPSQTVDVINQDNDRAGVTVALQTGIDPSDTSRLRTSENRDTATFTVVLNNAPQKNVTVPVTSTSTEGSATPALLTFTPDNWGSQQTVTVEGVDNDSVADGNQPYQVALGPTKSDDADYDGLTPSVVNVVNVDNDTANYLVTLLTSIDPNDASRLLTTEAKSSATFSVVLTSKPKAPVTLGVTSTNSHEGTVDPAQLDFPVKDWNLPQIVTVTGVDDSAKDGNVVYIVRISAPTSDDPAYQKLGPTDVKVVNLDDDVASITPPKLLSGIDSGNKLVTTEKNKGSATFSVSLTSQPTDNVTLPVSSSDTSEGIVSPMTLTFTPMNYATPQIVTVTGVDDAIQDGDQAYTVTVGPATPAMSKDMNYVGLSQSVKVTNKDDDVAYIVPSVYMGTTTEKGGSTVFGISLSTQPTDTVTVTFASSNTKEGKVSPASLTFTTSNWASPQNITVTGVNDDVADGDQMYTISVTGSSADQNYKYASTTLSLVNQDDNPVGLKITAAANLQTTEAGGKATFTVALTSQPTGNVNVTVSSSDTKEGTAAPASLTFSASNWSTAQTVTVTGVDDSIADGTKAYTVTLKTASTSADAKYAQLAASMVSLTNTNDDTVGITVAPTTCATTPGTTATFSVVLKSQPLGPVSIALSSDTPTEGTVAPATLSFTAMTWNVAQPVTVTGVDDGTMGVMTPYKIVTAAATSAMDASYNGINAADVACVNTTDAPPPPPASP